MNQPVVDGGIRGLIAAGLAGPVAAVVLLTGMPDVVNALLTPTCVMAGFLLGGVYDGYVRKP